MGAEPRLSPPTRRRAAQIAFIAKSREEERKKVAPV
jgi:hypothetical protein